MKLVSHSWVLLLTCFLAACSSTIPNLSTQSEVKPSVAQLELSSSQNKPKTTQNAPTTSPTAITPIPPTPEYSQPTLSTKFTKTTRHGITLSLVSFDDRKHSLALVDQLKGPGSQYNHSKHLGQSKGALAVLNGGFFNPDGSPLGQLRTYNTARGSYNSSSLGSGYLLWSASRPPMIVRSERYRSIGRPPYKHLLQTGPMLAEQYRSISKLNRTNNRTRSFLAWDGKHHWILGHASACSLHQLSKTLANQNLSGFRIHTALNLDGGRSSDLWISKTITEKEIHIRPFWNKPVRNFLLLK